MLSGYKQYIAAILLGAIAWAKANGYEFPEQFQEVALYVVAAFAVAANRHALEKLEKIAAAAGDPDDTAEALKSAKKKKKR